MTRIFRELVLWALLVLLVALVGAGIVPTSVKAQGLVTFIQNGGYDKSGRSADISASTVNSSVALPTTSGETILVMNVGSTTVFVQMGSAAVAATAAAGIPVLPGSSITLARGGNTHVAAITSSGTSTVSVMRGTGVPAMTPGLGTASAAMAVTNTPSSAASAATISAQSGAAGSNLVLKASAGNLYDLSINIGATSGYIMLFDATALPSNGAVTPVFCQSVNSNGTNGGASFVWPTPKRFGTGITAGFSTTGCYTLTASATAAFFGGYQ